MTPDSHELFAEPAPGSGGSASKFTGADTIPDLLSRHVATRPDHRALVDDDAAVTYAELDDASRALAARLVAAGVSKGDRVGLLVPNGVPWATTALAVMRVGAVLVPLSTLLRPPELTAQLRTASVTHLVVVPRFRDRDYLADLASVLPSSPASVLAPNHGAPTPDLGAGTPEGRHPGLPHPAVPSLRAVWTADGIPDDAVAPEIVAASEDRVRAADDMVVLFTSGSRGAPKGTIHTHGSALRAVAAGLEARRVGSDDRLYIPMPFFWTGGFAGGLLTVLVAGATLLTEAVPEPGRTLAMLERERVTLFRGWPDQAARLAAHPAFAGTDLSSLRPGSLPAVLPPDRRPAAGARPNLFGMTETFGPWCGDRLDVDLPAAQRGSCGRPFPGMDVRIADPDTGEPQPPGCTGEIWLRGPTLLRGLCGRERSTVFTPDGFYRTGDLGRFDGQGYLWYAGRLDDMVKVRGATVYPSEVEAALRALPGVAHAHVTAVPALPGAASTGSVRGMWRPHTTSRSQDDEGARGDDDDAGAVQLGALVVSDRDVAAIVAAARERLSAFKVPTVWLVVPDLGRVPVGATGKVDKAGLQELLRSRGAPAPAPASPSPTGQEGSAR